MTMHKRLFGKDKRWYGRTSVHPYLRMAERHARMRCRAVDVCRLDNGGYVLYLHGDAPANLLVAHTVAPDGTITPPEPPDIA